MNKRLLACLVAACISMPTQASSIQILWQTFYQRSWETSALTVRQAEIDQYPISLLLSSSDYPNFNQFTWSDIEALYQVTQTCRAPEKVSRVLQKATEFELALCQSRVLPNTWFMNKPFVHPAGGSFVDRYLERILSVNPDNDDRQLLSLTSGSSPHHPLFGVFEQISPQGRDALLSGSRAWFEGRTLWLSGEQGWKKVSSSNWRPIAEQLNITLDKEKCDFRYSNLCIARRSSESFWGQLTVAVLSISLLAVVLRSWYVKRQQSIARRFVLQLLTHELRTPITSLGLTTEMLRDQFDNLNEDGQQAFWRLTEDYQRLSQLTEHSKTYLSDNGDYALQAGSLGDWLAQVCSAHNVRYTVENDQQLTLPFYWLSICLNNLIVNALRHGSAPVHVEAIVSRHLQITVCDQGRFPTRYQRWLKRPSNNENMGIGLKLVRHLIQQMGGRLLIKTHPTRITMELPI